MSGPKVRALALATSSWKGGSGAAFSVDVMRIKDDDIVADNESVTFAFVPADIEAPYIFRGG